MALSGNSDAAGGGSVQQGNDEGAGGRLLAIDVLRAVAIFWVVLFHVWGDIEFFPGAPSGYYEALGNRIDGSHGAWAAFTAFTDLVFRLGFQGVPLFMTISGISLTIAAYRSGAGLRWPRFVWQRMRKLLLPYWAGVALTFGVMAAIAWRQVATSDVAFADAFTGGVTISAGSRVNVDWGVVFASVALIPRLVRAEWFFAPQLALWFVGLIAQYYLLFPLLFLIMRRAGVLALLVGSFALTVGANWWIVDRYGAPEFKFWLVTGWAPFRLFEFTAGMAIGWLLAAPEARRWLSIVRHPATIIAAVAAGLAAHTAGDLMIGEWTLRYWQALALPLVTLGLALWAMAAVCAPPASWRGVAPVRWFATLGVMSYAILIVNDAMRLVASQIRIEGHGDAVWWTFLVAIYIPASVLLAWPLARVLGLMPRRRRVAEPVEHAPRIEPHGAPAMAAAPVYRQPS